MDDISSKIRSLAICEGFCCYGIVDRDLLDSLDLPSKFKEFIRRGYQGDMHWLENNISLRTDVFSRDKKINSIIVLGVDYAPDFDPLAKLKQSDYGLISIYAQSRDYHKVIKRRLKSLSKLIEKRYDCECLYYVDTGPLMEKPLAASAGLGWQGKHTNLVSREFGSWLFLGVIMTSLKLTSDNNFSEITKNYTKNPTKSIKNYCGSCKKCLDICPTNSFIAPYKIDARRCISYLTIEYKGLIPLKFRPLIGNRIFGCDDCLSVCPWNKFASSASEFKREFGRSYMSNLSLSHLVHFDEESFRHFFAGSAVLRAGWECFMRNILIAIGNSKKSDLLTPLWGYLSFKSVIIRATSIWSFARCCGVSRASLILYAYSRFAKSEKSPECILEWEWVRKTYLKDYIKE